ncbi:MAG: DUF998 domain-containing protein [Halobacteriota archaeon]
MSIENRSLLGALLFVGAAQFILVIAITEALYPGYSVATNFLSDLGVGQTALLFNASVAALGVCVFIGSLIGRRTLGRGLTITLAITGACAVGVGRFPETTGAPHVVFSIAIFVFGAVSAITSHRVLRPPLSHFSVGLGIIALVALVLMFTLHDLGIGLGGMERMTAYPILLWALGFGGSLIGAK